MQPSSVVEMCIRCSKAAFDVTVDVTVDVEIDFDGDVGVGVESICVVKPPSQETSHNMLPGGSGFSFGPAHSLTFDTL